MALRLHCVGTHSLHLGWLRHSDRALSEARAFGGTASSREDRRSGCRPRISGAGNGEDSPNVPGRHPADIKGHAAGGRGMGAGGKADEFRRRHAGECKGIKGDATETHLIEAMKDDALLKCLILLI